MDISKAVQDILSKNASLEEVTAECSAEELQDIQDTIASVKEKLNKNMAMGYPDTMVKFDANGQWSMVKALNYAEMNKPKHKPDSETQTIDYSSGTPEIKGKKWNVTGSKAPSRPTKPVGEKKPESALDTIKRRRTPKP